MSKVPILFLFTFFVCVLARGESYGEEFQGNQGVGNFQRSQGFPGENFDRPSGNNGRQQFGDSKRYRSNLFSDDDVYGYDANYPNGEALYINYRNKDARARRGPEFARTSRAYSRQGGRQGEQQSFERGFGIGPFQGFGRATF